MEEMDSPTYEQAWITHFVTNCAHGLQSRSAARVFEEYISETRKTYITFRIHAVLAGSLMLVARLTRLSRPYKTQIAVCVPEKGNFWDIRYMAEAFLDFTASESKGVQFIDAASRSLQDRGEKLLEQADRARSIGEYHGSIYESMIWFFGAFRGFEFLGRKGPTEHADRFKADCCACDERLAMGYASMYNSFANSLDHRQLLIHREKIRILRETKGPFAAQQLANQYIQLQMYYPSFFRPYLLGETDDLTLNVRPRPKGGAKKRRKRSL